MTERALQLTLAICDETDQKHGTLTATADTTWSEVTERGITLLDLPTEVQDTPVLYHAFDFATGDALLPQQTLSEVVNGLPADSAFCVRLSPEMRPAAC